MGLGYRLVSRPMLGLQDSEKAHARAILGLKLMCSNPITRTALNLSYGPQSLKVTRFGAQYPNPFGLAAGMDKRAEALRGWTTLGLGFIEIGGVTAEEQLGNPKPRMFRSGGSKALINRMGFNNPGSANMAIQLKRHFARYGRPIVPLWANLGKSKITPLTEAPADYATTMERLYPYCDVFVINVSSPNTPNLRELQHDDALANIVAACNTVNQQQSQQLGVDAKPLLVKIAPDLSDDQLVAVVKTAREAGCDGIVATNTTIERPETNNARDQTVFAEAGGLSGAPVAARSTAMIHRIYELTNGEWPIVGVGGISNAEDAWEKIGAGACLLQAYSGFVFEGPSLTKSVVNGLNKKLKQSQFTTLDEAVGFSHRQSPRVDE
ncbi:quinone-dependent dihydroorotate dehydrogenase [Candidatus Poseidoniaceae archaeon]|nr:quinone-dependent dihydroorotate dehydrogenase [Candidatus Poseidoniaceae archaeon]